MKYASFLVRAPCIRTKGVGCPFLAQKNWKNLGVTENCSHIYLLNELLPDRNLNTYGECFQLGKIPVFNLSNRRIHLDEENFR